MMKKIVDGELYYLITPQEKKELDKLIFANSKDEEVVQ